MYHFESDLFHSDKRIVAVSKWRNPCSDYHLRSTYYGNNVGYDKGFRNFFNEDLDIMTVSQAQKHLNWIMPKRKIKASKRSTTHNADGKNEYLTLRVYPSSDFYFGVGKSQAERESVFRDAIRQSMIKLIAETAIPLNWVAAVNASSRFMVGMIVISKRIFDGETGQFGMMKDCFPKAFFERDKPTAENTNHIEKEIAKALFDCAAQTKDFENRIDDLIEISRKYKFELPLSYYALRYLDGEGNLITERERRWLYQKRLSRYEQFTLERKSPAKS